MQTRMDYWLLCLKGKKCTISGNINALMDHLKILTSVKCHKDNLSIKDQNMENVENFSHSTKNHQVMGVMGFQHESSFLVSLNLPTRFHSVIKLFPK
jgi:HD superfamily phosphohydrolase